MAVCKRRRFHQSTHSAVASSTCSSERQVCNPQAVRRSGGEVPLDQIGWSGVQLSGPGREAFALAADDAFEVQLVHESGDAVATNARALTIELVRDLLDPVDAEVVAVDAADFEFEALIVLVASRQRTPYRGVV